MVSDSRSDRDLDAYLAEHLLGLAHPWPNGGTCYCADGAHAWESESAIPPLYSSTGDGMLLILEAMSELDWYGHVIAPLSKRQGQWNAQFVQRARGEHGFGSAWASSAPRAVAEAAADALVAPPPACPPPGGSGREH